MNLMFLTTPVLLTALFTGQALAGDTKNNGQLAAAIDEAGAQKKMCLEQATKKYPGDELGIAMEYASCLKPVTSVPSGDLVITASILPPPSQSAPAKIPPSATVNIRYTLPLAGTGTRTLPPPDGDSTPTSKDGDSFPSEYKWVDELLRELVDEGKINSYGRDAVIQGNPDSPGIYNDDEPLLHPQYYVKRPNLEESNPAEVAVVVVPSSNPLAKRIINNSPSTTVALSPRGKREKPEDYENRVITLLYSVSGGAVTHQDKHTYEEYIQARENWDAIQRQRAEEESLRSSIDSSRESECLEYANKNGRDNKLLIARTYDDCMHSVQDKSK